LLQYNQDSLKINITQDLFEIALYLNTIIHKPGRGEVGDQGGYPPLLVRFVNFEKSYGVGGVAKLLAEGKSSKEIAELSYISRYTVRRHRDNIRRKLELKGLVDLVRYAMEHGYISDNS
jgi:hypothetical protein